MGGNFSSVSQFWRNKRVLITGHTGFKGAWLSLWLRELGAEVIGIGLAPNTCPNLYEALKVESFVTGHILDIRDYGALATVVKQTDPEIVFHMAAQALVIEGYENPLDTFSINVQGSANLLEALLYSHSIKAVVVVTTDKVYKNLELQKLFSETDELGGHDPYSASKAAAEFIVASYRDAFFSKRSVGLATARAGNVIGGGDWSKDRLIPDAIRAWSKDGSLEIRRPNAVRPWQHVLESLYAYLKLGQQLYDNRSISGAYNFGPSQKDLASVGDVIGRCQKFYNSGKVIVSESEHFPHEANYLALDNSKALRILGVNPKWCLDDAIEKTISWYKAFYSGETAYDLCKKDINEYWTRC
jgi:CDP-glucose 4,6-dehydratase